MSENYGARARTRGVRPRGFPALLWILPLLWTFLPAQNLTPEQEVFVRETGRLVFVSQTHYEPFEFRGESGQMEGMMVDLARWIAGHYGIDAEFRDTTFVGAQAAVLSGEADVLTSIFYSPLRDQSFDFTDPVFDVPASIFVRAERSDIRGLQDLNTRRIAMQEGDYAREFLERNGIEFDRITTENFASAAEVVISGGADALIGDEQIVIDHLYSTGQADQLKIVGDPLYTGRNCLAVREGRDVLLSLLNDGVAEARRQGVIQEIEERWLGRPLAEADPETWIERNARNLGLGLTALAFLLILILLWTLTLQVQVRRRTRELQTKREQLAQAVDLARLAPWEFDPVTRRLHVGDDFYKTLRTSVAEEGTSELSLEEFGERFLPPENRNELLPIVARVLSRLQDGRSHSLRYRALRRDGSTGYFTATFILEREPSGSPSRVIGTSQDISDMERARLDLRESQRRLDLAIRGADLAMWDWNVRTGEVSINDRWARLLGVDPSELDPRGGEWRKRLHPDDRERVLAGVDAHLRGETPIYSAEYRLRHADGSWIWILGQGSVVERDENGNPLRMSGTHLDITERKIQEQQRAELDARMQNIARLESLSVLAGGIAHDFNNLLVGILGSAAMAAREVPSESPAGESLELIERTARQAADLTRQMLAYSGKGRFVVRIISLTQLACEMSHLLESAIARRARLVLDLDDQCPGVMADETQIRQVIMNLILNAAEAVGEDERGEIILRTGLLEADDGYLAGNRAEEPPEPGRYAWMEVQDNGAGMDEVTASRIFEPFFSTKTSGHGLGLAAVQGIIRGHGGFLRVTSRPGEGTTIRFGLPLATTKERTLAREDPAVPAESYRSEGTVLVVDDQPSVRRVLERMLQRAGFSVLLAEGGADALRILGEAESGVCLVMMDMTMPGMNGEEAFARLREISDRLPVIFMSGYTAREKVSSVLDDPVTTFLQKPFSPAELQEALRQVFARQEAVFPLESGEAIEP